MIIFDCDNCISDDEWRIRTIDWEFDDPMMRYATYHSLSRYDEPRNLHLMVPGQQIAIFTAMPESDRMLRATWLAKHNVPVDFLFMRRDDDFRPSAEVKQDMLFELCRRTGFDPRSISAAYDDRADVIQMYKRNGVNGINLAIHNNCAWSRPLEK